MAWNSETEVCEDFNDNHEHCKIQDDGDCIECSDNNV